MTMEARPTVAIVPHSLRAVLDRQSGKAHSFYVTVDIEVDAASEVDLVSARPQGINLLIKLLRFAVVRPTGAAGATIARRTLRYRETPPGADYAEVWLGDGDRAVSAKVVVVT